MRENERTITEFTLTRNDLRVLGILKDGEQVIYIALKDGPDGKGISIEVIDEFSKVRR